MFLPLAPNLSLAGGTFRPFDAASQEYFSSKKSERRLPHSVSGNAGIAQVEVPPVRTLIPSPDDWEHIAPVTLDAGVYIEAPNVPHCVWREDSPRLIAHKN